MKLKKKIPSDKFTVILQRPFVVIGDESHKTVKRRSQGTVKWAVDLLISLSAHLDVIFFFRTIIDSIAWRGNVLFVFGARLWRNSSETLCRRKTDARSSRRRVVAGFARGHSLPCRRRPNVTPSLVAYESNGF